MKRNLTVGVTLIALATAAPALAVAFRWHQ
jgi:hypothetical protein